MLIEGLGSVTYVNGILRVQCVSVNPKGDYSNSGTLEIPGANVNDVLNGLIASAKGIEEKLNENAGLDNDSKKKPSKKKASKK